MWMEDVYKRQIFRYAESTLWPYDFAPHDVGTYPILNGQAYSGGTDPEGQMPVEECGNLLVMAAAVAQAEDNAAFAREHRPLLEKWAQYLLQNGLDPDDQLCTDDFAGHLAHNCNLSIKATMGLAGYARLCRQWNDTEQAELYREAAAEMAAVWLQKAANGAVSYTHLVPRCAPWARRSLARIPRRFSAPGRLRRTG